jgi:integrase
VSAAGRAEPEPRQQKDGTWKVNYMVDGVRRSAYGPATPVHAAGCACATCRAGKNKARAKMREARKRLEAGLEARDSRVKLADWVETWRTVKLPAGNRKASTNERYMQVVRLWVLPTLEARKVARVADVRESDCEAVMVAMKAAGKAPNYRRIVHAAMRSLFGAAVRERIITTGDPMEHVEKPGSGKTRAVAMEPDQVAGLFGHLSRTPTLLQLVPFLALTGTRRGEALGVGWDDVDEDAGLIHLRWQVTRTQEKGLHLAPLKTADDESDDDGRTR